MLFNLILYSLFFILILSLDLNSYPPANYTPTSDHLISDLIFTQIPNIPINTPNQSGIWNFENDITFCFKPTEWMTSFDDGPGPSTPGLLDQLKIINVKTTFFIIGSNALLHPHVLKRAFDEGHEIAIHTWSHPYLTRLSNAQIVSELVWTARIIYQITGSIPRYVRPPYGDIDDRVRALINALGFQVVIWNRDTNDHYLDKWPSLNIQNITPNDVISSFKTWSLNPPPRGIISLQHDRFPESARVAPNAIKEILASKSFSTVTISQCTRDPPYGNILLSAYFSFIDNSTLNECTNPVFYHARDYYGNLFGFENGFSCFVGPNTPITPLKFNGFPICKNQVRFPSLDSKGFKYGKESGSSCIVPPL